MKQVFQILSLIFMYFLFSAKSCSNQEEFNAFREQERIKSAKDSITATMGSDSLSGSALKAFESDAIQKFRDFADYMNILADTAYAPVFKEQAKEMIIRLFISGDTQFRLTDGKNKIMNESTINTLTRNNALPYDPSVRIMPESIEVTLPFGKINDTLYSGSLKFRFTQPIYPVGNEPVSSPEGGTINVYLVKKVKHFGSEKWKVWNVFLGEMELSGFWMPRQT